MYFLSEIEQKYLNQKLFPLTRKVGVSPDLRGFSWHKSPIKPYFENVKIPMYLVTSGYCPNSRDVFINKVLGKRGVINYYVSAGLSVHKTVSILHNLFLENNSKVPNYKDWIAKNEKNIYYPGITAEKKENIKKFMEQVWNYCYSFLQTKFLETATTQPYASHRDRLATSIPFLIEHRISGELLGLSGILS
ncbi:MAG: CRISPR-associated protein Cas4, partial [Candidatus Helarchaeota archaeon]